jgi:hypothetical protein
MNKKGLTLSCLVLFLFLLSLISVVSATNPVKLIKGDHYDGQGIITCGWTWVSGPLHVVVNEETGEISAWGRHSYFLMMNWGMSSYPALAFKGTITRKEPIDDGFEYYFTFTEHYHDRNLRGAGTGFFRIRPSLGEFVVHLNEG